MNHSKHSETPKLHHVILLFTLLIPLASHPLRADDWPRWRGVNLDGISAEKNWSAQWPPEGPKQLWKTKLGTAYSSVSVVSNRLYTMGNKNSTDYVYCLDAATGEEIWSHTYPAPLTDNLYSGGPNATPTVDGKLVYTVGKEGNLFCLDAATGKVVWQKHFQKDFQSKKPDWGFSCSPLVEGNMLIVEVGGSGAAVVAFNKLNGQVIWKSGHNRAGYGSPVAYGAGAQRAIAVFHDKAIVGYSARDGKELWRHPWETSYDVNAATPIVAGDKVFVSSGYGRGATLIQIGTGAPKVIWENKNMRNHMNSCVLLDGYLYGIDEDRLACLDLKTGATKWTERKFGKGSLMAADGKLILLSDKGLLAVAKASPNGYEEISSAQVIGGKNLWVVPVLANGRMYCRSHETLVCLDVSGKR